MTFFMMLAGKVINLYNVISMNQDDYEYDDEVEEGENKPTALAVTPVEEEEIEDTLGGKALNAFSKLFFVLTIIGTVLAAVMVFLPIFLVIVGIISTIVWIVGIIFVSVFTLGLIWTSSDFKSFNEGWMAFNTSMFNSSNSLNEFAMSAVPFVLISGGIIITLSWLFTILGRVFDRVRISKYKGRIIGLTIITILYIVFLVLNIIIHQNS